jgi:hypothetical protein
MAEFNHYQAWLQVPVAAGETPTYYKLLGLTEFEEDSQAISKASEKQLSRLLAINPEKHRPQWQKLINDLAEAQSILSHPQHKTAYDNKLRGVTEPVATKPTATKPAAPKSVAAAPAATASTPAPASPMSAAVPQQATPAQAAVPQVGSPQAPSPQAPYTPNGGYPAYGQPGYQPPNYANPAAAAPQYGQPVYAQPVYGQQPQTAPLAQPVQPYGQPQYGQAPYAQPQQPGYGQPVYAQPVYGQPVNPAPYAQPAYGQPVYQAAPASPAQPYGYGAPAAPVYEATPAHDPFAPAAPHNPMAAFGAAAGFGSAAGQSNAVVNPMAALNNSRGPLPGTSQSFVEEDASFGSSMPSSKAYRIPRKESPVLYIVLAGFALIAIVGGLAGYSMLNSNKTPEHTAQSEHPPTPKKPKNTEIVPVSTPAELKPEPAKPEVMKPVTPKPMEPTKKAPHPAPIGTDPEMTDPEMAGPSMPQPEMKKPEPKKPEPKPEVVKKPETVKPEPAKPMTATSAKATPEEKKAVIAKLAEARTLVSERKFSDAKRVLKEAGELAKTPDVQDLHDGMEMVTNYNEQFWQAVKTAMRTANGEINIGSTPANIVSSDANEITIRMPGKNISATYENMPAGLAVALAKRWFDNKSANKAALGAFYFGSKAPKIDDARALLQEADNLGTDTKHMLLLLNEPGILGK